MNSALYTCKVMHQRISPVRHSFTYRLFMFWLDLDEIPTLAQRFLFLSHNGFNAYDFRESDHIQTEPTTLKDGICTLLEQHGIVRRPTRIMLLTHLRTWGYVFNPVSFYFCFDDRQPVAVVAEVGNTFGEKKAFVLKPETWDGTAFRERRTKFFYVSPFADMDAEFDFHLEVPDEELRLRIHGISKDRRFFFSSLTGRRRVLSNSSLLITALRFPLVTLQVIYAIHWQAFRLWRKKLPYYKKTDHPELQKEVYGGTSIALVNSASS